MKDSIHIYLFAGHELLLETLRAAVDSTRGLSCVGAAGSLSRVLDGLEHVDADLVVIEASDGDRALEQVRELTDARPHLRVLAVGLAGARQAVRFLEAGASGFLLKDEPWSKVQETARGILAGRTPCSPRVAAMVYRRLAELARSEITRAELARRREPARARPKTLSRREAQVLRLLAIGLRNKEIARHLGIALSTAANHVQRVLEKLGAHRRRDAVRHACRLGLVEVPALARSA